MLVVRDVMKSDPIALEPDDSLGMAAEVLTTAGISGAPVVARGHLVGVASLADILAFEADEPGVPRFRPEMAEPYDDDAEDGIDDPNESDEPDASWFARLWEDGEVDASRRMDDSAGPEWDPLDEHTIAEVMTPVGAHVGPLTPLIEAARRMDEEKLHRLVVLDGEVPVGILTSSDVVRALARGRIVPGFGS
jgi:CBS domain-containing protein